MTIINILFNSVVFGLCLWGYNDYRNQASNMLLFYYFTPLFINFFMWPRLVHTETPADYSMEIVGKIISLIPTFNIVSLLFVILILSISDFDRFFMIGGKNYRRVKLARKNKFKKDIEGFFSKRKAASEKIMKKIDAEERNDMNKKIKSLKKEISALGQSELDELWRFTESYAENPTEK